MTKLHEILAVEADKEGIAKRIIEETVANFKGKHHLFQGHTKTLTMDVADESNASVEAAAFEEQIIATTVPARLEYTEKSISDWLDVVLIKETTNQTGAKADLEIDGFVIATDVPATFLLGLESKLKHIRTIYDNMPTLAPGIKWVADFENSGNNIFAAELPDVKAKTQKRPQFTILHAPTDHHPAQIEKWSEEVVVGRYTTNFKSGMLPAAVKSRIIARIDLLTQAVKKARQKANNTEIVQKSIGNKLFEYIHGIS